MPYSPMKKSCIKMYDEKGKQTGLMMEGSAMHMSMLHKETDKQEAKNDLDDTPVQDKASAMEMSPYKMDHGDSAMKMSPYKMDHPGESGEKSKKEKKESTLSDKDKWIDKKLNELARTKPDMSALERLKFARNSYEMLPKKTK
jgi:hypothetical protein